MRLAVVGLGNIGEIHVSKVAESGSAHLVSVSDPTERGDEFAVRLGIPNRADYRDVLDDDPEAVIISVPNELHREIATFFASSGVHLLVEKPLAESVAAGRAIVDAAEAGGVHLLVGHHRRHNNLVVAARRLVKERIGTLLATNSLVTMRKPDSYYDIGWRRGRNAGPLPVNVIHEIDNLRTISGEIAAVQAAASNLARGFEFEDTIAIALEYDSGAVGTVTVTESTPSPWSWEASVVEGISYPTYGQDHAVFLGTEGSLSFPSLKLWHFHDADEPGWMSPLTTSDFETKPNDPYLDQIENLTRTIRGLGSPVVDGLDALRSLAVVEAIREAGATGSRVRIASVLGAEPE